LSASRLNKRQIREDQRQGATGAASHAIHGQLPWSVIRDVGALHTRLVPGFVTDTRLSPGRIVTFVNGTVLREPIIEARRLVWSAEGGLFTHYNASLQVFAEGGNATRVVWIADFLPDEVAGNQQAAMETALQIMKTTLDQLAEN
jgi:hypothetical protein